MATKLTRIVLEFDDGTTHVVEQGYSAVYKSPERAKRANEREPWKEPPGQSGSRRSRLDRGKDDSSGDGDTGTNCYKINGVIVCP